MSHYALWIKTPKKEDGAQLETDLPLAGEYEALLQNAPKRYDFPDLDENTKATTFYTTGTTGDPKGVHFSHRQLLLQTLSNAIGFGSYNTIGRFRSNDVYRPRCHQNRRRVGFFAGPGKPDEPA